MSNCKHKDASERRGFLLLRSGKRERTCNSCFHRAASQGFSCCIAQHVLNMCSPTAGEPILWFATSENTALHPSPSSSTHAIPHPHSRLRGADPFFMLFSHCHKLAGLLQSGNNYTFLSFRWVIFLPGTVSPISPGVDACLVMRLGSWLPFPREQPSLAAP